MLFPAENAEGCSGAGSNLVAYYDGTPTAPGNAVRSATDHPATITSEGQFICSRPTSVPGDGDIYVGFETTYVAASR